MMETAGEPDDGAAELLDRPLPDGVRRRVVQIVSDGFGGLTVAELPAQLRQYARFAPNRRAKFAGNAMAAALESDALFRQRIAEKLREAQPELRAALDAAAPPAGRGSARCGGRGLRAAPRGLGEAGDRRGRGGPAGGRRACRRGEPGRAGAAARGTRRGARPGPAETERLRTELDAARREADALRRKLRGALSDVKRGEAALRKLQGRLTRPRAESQAQVSAAESESRRLKARLAEAEAALEATRKAAREGRSVEDMRVRLLLDTVLDAAQGLRRELALPPRLGAARGDGGGGRARAG